MGAPTAVINKETIGRRGHVTVLVEWTAADADDLSAVVVLDPDLDASGHYQNTRFKVLNGTFNSDSGTEAKLEFDTLPTADALIVAVAGDATSGGFDFSNTLHGNRPDPNRDTPSKITLTTTGSVPGTALFLEFNYLEAGTIPG